MAKGWWGDVRDRRADTEGELAPESELQELQDLDKKGKGGRMEKEE